jgi:hypothetical protein
VIGRNAQLPTRTYGRVAELTNNAGLACVALPDAFSGVASVIAAGYSIEDANPLGGIQYCVGVSDSLGMGTGTPPSL